MKSALRLEDKKAQEQVKQFAYIALASACVSLFILWWLGIAAIGLGVRSFLLTYHKANQKRNDLTKLRVVSGLAAILGLGSLIAFHAVK